MRTTSAAATGKAVNNAHPQSPALCKRPALVLLDAYGTLFAPVSYGSPVVRLCQLLVADGVHVDPKSAERALFAEIRLYRERFPYIRDQQELGQLELAASDVMLAELAIKQFPRERMRLHLLDLFRLEVFSDVNPALGRLQERRLALGVVSNFNAMLGDYLAQLDLKEWFSVVVCSADVGVTKPDPVIFHAAIKHLGMLPEQAIYVGDDLHNDYHGARQAGLHAVWLNRDGAPTPDGVRSITTLAELPGLLNQVSS